MHNINIDSNGFFDRLGIYDFFNVVLSGVVFLLGLCVIHPRMFWHLSDDPDFIKIIIILICVYLSGLIMQDAGSYIDRKVTKIYSGMTSRLLKINFASSFGEHTEGYIIHNPFLLKAYRDSAQNILRKHGLVEYKNPFENDRINQFIFSYCHYNVSAQGKDKKVEKLRALFAMSKTLMATFAILSTLSLLFSLVVIVISLINKNFSFNIFIYLAGKTGFLVLLSVLCWNRAKRTMKNFLLIMMGTYYALENI